VESSLIHEHAARDFETRRYQEISFARLIDNDVPSTREQHLSDNHNTVIITGHITDRITGHFDIKAHFCLCH